MALKGINVVVLFVGDVPRSRAFYEETLGLTKSFEDEGSAFFELEGASLLLLSIPDAQDLLSSRLVPADLPATSSSQHVIFVDDVHALHRDLRARGVQFVREPIDRPWGMRTAHFRDPDGHIWEIAQPIPAVEGE